MSEQHPRHAAVDLHQHLWPEELVDRLRARSKPPYLRGWTLVTAGEPRYRVAPEAHDVERRIAQDHHAEVGTACLGLSSPLGIEALPRPEASLLLRAWEHGVRRLPDHFRAWASVPSTDPDPASVTRLLAQDRWVGLQLPATDLLSPVAWERAAPLLRAAEVAGKPVLVHPGPETSSVLTGRPPEWWAPVVGYVGQLTAAWWGWHAVGGRALLPDLRVVFAAAAGLAPVHHERHAIRGGESRAVDPGVYVDTSGYGPRALDAVVRVLGVDQVVLGSDRPYAEPLDHFLGAAATHALRVTNPRRVLGLGEGVVPWPAAS